MIWKYLKNFCTKINQMADYEEDDYSRPAVENGDGPPSARIRERREHQTSAQSQYSHLKVKDKYFKK
jgi:hypothetical protein